MPLFGPADDLFDTPSATKPGPSCGPSSNDKAKIGPPPLLADRIFFEAVLYIARPGIPCRDLPAEFGAWDAVSNRLRRWIDSRRLGNLFKDLVAQPACEGTIRVMVESTIVEAHQHSAGASKKNRGPSLAGDRPEPGGLTTTIIAVVTDEDSPIAADVAEGQRSDAPLALPVPAEAKAPLGWIDEMLGDKGFDPDAIRSPCPEQHDALPVIPNKRNRKEPWPWDAEMKETHKRRNRIERSFAKAKRYQRLATRYEKLKEMFLGVVRLAFGFIRIRKVALSVNIP